MTSWPRETYIINGASGVVAEPRPKSHQGLAAHVDDVGDAIRRLTRCVIQFSVRTDPVARILTHQRRRRKTPCFRQGRRRRAIASQVLIDDDAADANHLLLITDRKLPLHNRRQRSWRQAAQRHRDATKHIHDMHKFKSTEKTTDRRPRRPRRPRPRRSVSHDVTLGHVQVRHSRCTMFCVTSSSFAPSFVASFPYRLIRRKVCAPTPPTPESSTPAHGRPAQREPSVGGGWVGVGAIV